MTRDVAREALRTITKVTNLWKFFDRGQRQEQKKGLRQEQKKGLVSTLARVLTGEQPSIRMDEGHPVSVEFRRDLTMLRETLHQPFLCFILDGTADPSEYGECVSDGHSHRTSPTSLLSGTDWNVSESSPIRPLPIVCHLVEMDRIRGTVGPLTALADRRAGKTIRVSTRRGLEAFLRATLAKKPQAELAIMAQRNLLERRFGVSALWRLPPRSKWADPRESAKRGLRNSLGLRPTGSTPKIHVEFLQGLRGSNRLRNVDALLVLGTSFPHKPHAEHRWSQKAEEILIQAIGRLRAGQRQPDDPALLVLWGGTNSNHIQAVMDGCEEHEFHASMDEYLSSVGYAPRRHHRGLAPVGRLLARYAPRGPFFTDGLKRSIRGALGHTRDQLREDVAGIEGFAGIEFEKGAFRSLRKDLGLGVRGQAIAGSGPFLQIANALPEPYRHELREQRAIVQDILLGRSIKGPMKKYPGRLVKEEGDRIDALRRERWFRLVPVCVRVFLLGLLGRMELADRRSLDRLLQNAGFQRERGGPWHRPWLS